MLGIRLLPRSGYYPILIYVHSDCGEDADREQVKRQPNVSKLGINLRLKTKLLRS